MTGPFRSRPPEKGRLHPDHVSYDMPAVLITATAVFFAEYYRRLRDNPPKKRASGYRTGKVKADEVICLLVRRCHEADMVPPVELVEAVELALSYEFKDKPENRAYLSKPFDELTNYFILNPEASKRQANRDTRIARATIDRYMAHPKWDQVLKAKRMQCTPDQIRSGSYDADSIAMLAGVWPEDEREERAPTKQDREPQ